MNPDGVRKMIVDNICGVRLDGTNATIIGSRQGEFLADRNHIVRSEEHTSELQSLA